MNTRMLDSAASVCIDAAVCMGVLNISVVSTLAYLLFSTLLAQCKRFSFNSILKGRDFNGDRRILENSFLVGGDYREFLLLDERVLLALEGCRKRTDFCR